MLGERRAVAILETMWDWRGMTSGAGYREAVPFFTINSENYSGRRLYKLVGPGYSLLVTNACRLLANSAREHGKGDPVWLRENLAAIEALGAPIEVLLVCGKVAQKTFWASGYVTKGARIIEMPHPAARAYWTKAKIEETAQMIQGGFVYAKEG